MSIIIWGKRSPKFRTSVVSQSASPHTPSQESPDGWDRLDLPTYRVEKMDPTRLHSSPCPSSTPCLDGQQLCHLNCSSQTPECHPNSALLSISNSTIQLSVFTLESSQSVSSSAASLPLSRALDGACFVIKEVL